MSSISSVLRVSKESIDMSVKSSNCRVSGSGFTAVQDFFVGQRLRYLILAVLLQCFPFSVEAVTPVPRQEVRELCNGLINLLADGWEFRNEIEVPMLSRCRDCRRNGSDLSTESLSGGCSSGVSAASPRQVSGDKNDGQSAKNVSPVLSDEIQEFLHGAIFALPIVALVFLVSTPRDPWGGLPNPYTRGPNIQKTQHR
jgi:hypothetical protein